MPKFSASLHEAGDALRAGDRDTAWHKLRPALRYPAGLEMTDAEFARALGMLEMIGKGTLTPQTGAALSAARQAPRDIDALLQAGHHLVEADYPRVAATVLARGSSQASDHPALANELASVLAQCGRYGDAFYALQQAYAARQQDWNSRYLYVFNAIMSGHMLDARQGFSDLGAPGDEDAERRYGQLARFLERHALVAPTTPLDERDLRGWHHVVSGGMLTHVSPHGFDEGMNGRYATVQDTDALIHEGVLRAVAVLQAWQLRPQRLVYSSDRASEILAQVWHQRLGIPVRAFTGDDISAPGLFLAYDLRNAEPTFRHSLANYRPGQLLVSHASCWTEEAPFTSDISTFLYRSNTPPWAAGRRRVNPDTQLLEIVHADMADAEAIAARIITSSVPPEAVGDLDALASLARGAGRPPQSGARPRFYSGSPVLSSRSSRVMV